MLVFEKASSTGNGDEDGLPEISIPLFDSSQDPAGTASHVPHMDHFYDNSLQTGLMLDLAIDLEVLGEHVVLLGNQASMSCGSLRHIWLIFAIDSLM